MGNICSTRDENDLREKENKNYQSDTSTTAVKQKNVFKANPKGKVKSNM